MPILVLSLALLAACASQPPAYSKPGVAAGDQKRDENECLRASLGNNQRRRLLLYQIDRAAMRSVWRLGGTRSGSSKALSAGSVESKAGCLTPEGFDFLVCDPIV